MAMNVLLTLSSIIFPLITLPYVTRALGPEGVGKVYFASSVIAFFSMFAELGIPVYGIRACARVRDDKIALTRTVHEIITINLAACIIVYAVFAVSLICVPAFKADRNMFIIMSSLIVLNAIGAEWLYKALEKYTYITVRSVIFKFIALIAMLLMIKERSDYAVYGALTIFAASASNILNFINLRKFISIRPIGEYNYRRHIPAMMILFMMTVATTIYTNLDTSMLGFMKGDAEAGLYGVSVRIKLVLVNLITSVSAVLMPRTSYYFDRGMLRDANKLIINTLVAVCTVSLPTICFFVLFSPECIRLLAGDAFTGAILPMRIIVPAVLFIGISNIAGMQLLIPMGHEDKVTRAAWTGAAMDVALNILLIPRFASAGAAFATLAAEVAVTLYLLHWVRITTGDNIIKDIPLVSIVVAAAAAIPACLWVRKLPIVLLAKLALSACCFFAVYTIVLFIIWRKYGILRRD